MYSCHFGVYRRSLIEDIGGFRVGFEGSQDYDLVLRVTEKTTRICHIPKILYHWRMIPGSAAATVEAKDYAYEAARKALQDRLNREHNQGKVQNGLWTGAYRVRRHIDDRPLVSIVIPFKDEPQYLRRCLSSIQKSSYGNTEILLISNNSEEEETFSVVEEFRQQDARIRFHEYNQPFNYSEINNWGANQAKGKYLVFLNNDTEVISSGWIEAMLEQATRKPIGAVGAKLLYSNNTIQHSGVILGIVGVANHAFRHLPADHHGYFGYANVIRNYSAVTAACLMIEAKKFWEVGGFDEEHLAVAYNDIDLCLELMKKGYRNVYTPYAQLYHFESVSRENDKLAPEGLRFSQEKEFMQKKWGELINNDPYYNPNLTLDREDFSLRI
jgi:GT2 family glycosyltransferase